MALYSVSAGDRILAADLNQIINLLTGVSGTDAIRFLGASLTVGTSPATAGTIRVPNTGGLVSRNAANGDNETLIRFSSTDVIELGASLSSTVKIYGSVLSIGTTPATAGAVRVPNGSTNGLQARNAANSANAPLISLDSSDIVQISPNGQAVSVSGDTTFLGTFIALGAIPATAGAVRLPNNTAIYSRNSANSADIQLIGLNSPAASGIKIGETGYDIFVVGQSVSIGTLPSTAGVVRLPNNVSGGIAFRNAANTGNIAAVNVNGSDVLALYDARLGGVSLAKTQVADGTGHVAAGTLVWATT